LLCTSKKKIDKKKGEKFLVLGEQQADFKPVTQAYEIRASRKKYNLPWNVFPFHLHSRIPCSTPLPSRLKK